MRNILKPIFSFLTDGWVLFENDTHNIIAIGIIGFIAFMFAWKFVGLLYDLDAIHSKEAGSILHWLVRIIAFTAMFIVLSAIIWLVKFVLSVPWWVWIIVASAIIIIIVGNRFIKRKKEQNH